MTRRCGHAARSSARRWVPVLALASVGAASSARADEDPPRTWSVPAEPSPPAVPSSPAPAPPPATLGTPLDGAAAAPGTPEVPGAVPPPSIVRAPGLVGLRYTLEGVEVRGNTTTLARVVLRDVPFRAGDTLDVEDPELQQTRFRLLGTGFFRDVQLTLRKGTRRGYVVLVVHVVERNTMIVNDVWLGLSSDVGGNGEVRPLTAYGGVHVSETNLAGTGMTLGGALALADRQIGLRSRFVDRQFLRSSFIVEAEVLYNKARDFFGNRDVLVDAPASQAEKDYAVLDYRRFGGTLGLGHDVGTASQLFLSYRLEKIDAALPRGASHHRGLDVEPIDFQIFPGSSVLSSLRATLVRDTRDDPVLPTRGHHVVVSGEASLTPLGSDYPYARLVARGSTWTQLSWGHVLRVEAFGGAVFGDAPLFERFYVGDLSDFLPDRVLDLAFDRRPSPNFLDTAVVEVRYGQYALKMQGEYRVPLYRGQRAIYGVDLFGAAGVYGLANERDLRDPARGYAGLRAVPVDLTFNLGLRVSTSAGGFVFGFANVLGFAPVRGPQYGAAR